MGISVSSCSFQHFLLHSIQNFLYLCCKLFEFHYVFLSSISSADNSLSVLDILRTALDSYWNTAHFLLCEFESRALVCSICLHADSSCLKDLGKLLSFLKNAFFSLLDRDHNCLNRSDSWRKYESAVVTVNHDQGTDHTGSHSP